MAYKAKSGVYAIRNNVTGRVYLGSSKNIGQRLAHHRLALRSGTHINPHLLSSWRKHGEAAFSFEIVELVDEAGLVDRERFHIGAAPLRFNMVDAGRPPDLSGRPKSRAARRRMSLAAKARPRAQRRRHGRIVAALFRSDPEFRKRHSDAMKAVMATRTAEEKERFRRKMSGRMKRWWAERRRSGPADTKRN